MGVSGAALMFLESLSRKGSWKYFPVAHNVLVLQIRVIPSKSQIESYFGGEVHFN